MGFHKRLRFFLVAFLSCFCCFVSKAVAQSSSPFNFTQDGFVDAILVNIDSEKKLDWSVLSSDSNFTSTVTLVGGEDFGRNGDHLIPANWTSSSTPIIGYARYKKGTGVVWTVLDGESARSVTFGKKAAYHVSGGDYDNDGINDMAMISASGAATMRTNPFSGTPTDVNVKFSKRHKKRGKAFFYDPDGNGDRLALLVKAKNRNHLVSYDIAGKRTRARFIGRNKKAIRDVVPIQRPNGTDAVLLFLNRSAGTMNVRIQDPDNGQILFNKNFTSDKTILVGDYLDASGGEFALRDDDGGLTIVNPWTDPETSTTITNPAGVVADHINVFTFASTSSGGGEGSSGGGGSLGAVCPSIASFGAGRLWKPAADAEDNRRGKPALLFTGGSKSGVSSGAKNVYASNGEKICQLTYKASSIPGVNNGAAHFFSGWVGGCSLTAGQMASKARQAAGNTNVYVQWKGSTCLNVGDPTGRKGSI